jgi:hypothetical protein
MKLPIGYDNFGKVRDQNMLLVDKSLFIKELLDASVEVAVITRPRRFGKTLNLSMLHYFFAAEVYGQKTAGMFDDLNIARCEGSYLQHQGQYPVIFVTFKDIQEPSYELAYQKLSGLLADLFGQYHYLLDSPHLSEEEKQDYRAILQRTASQDRIENALKHLTYYLYQHHKTKPWLLIDEYDSPIQAAFEKQYYDDMIQLMRNVFGAAFKTNPYLNRAVVTGILRIAKESLFSGVNNLKVYSLFHTQYSQYFGFTPAEVMTLLQQEKLQDKAQAVQQWYNGYLIGNSVIYNPWSIINCLGESGELKPYWVHSSGNTLIKLLLGHANSETKQRLELLIQNQPITAIVDENMVFGDIRTNENALWSLLLFSGYLKALEFKRVGTSIECVLVPPNYEVLALYQGIVKGWFSETTGAGAYEAFLKTLVTGDVPEFILRLEDCLLKVFSVFDASGQHPEKFYHGFVLGLVVSLEKTHRVQSNRESGFGRYDVMLIPHDKTQLGIVMEFKVARGNQTLQASAEEALAQIDQRGYVEQLHSAGIQKILKLGMAFSGKQVAVASECNA